MNWETKKSAKLLCFFRTISIFTVFRLAFNKNGSKPDVYAAWVFLHAMSSMLIYGPDGICCNRLYAYLALIPAYAQE